MKKVMVTLVSAIILTGCTQAQNTPSQTTQTQTQPGPYSITAVDANTKQYTGNESGLSFNYPATWSFKDNFISEETPGLFVTEGYDINNCGLENCTETAKNLRQAIEDGTAPGIIAFQGGKGSLSVGCSGNEGYDLVPSPMYVFTFFRGDEGFTIELNDLSHRFPDLNGGSCMQTAYLKAITAPNQLNQADYKPYDDFIVLLRDTLELK